MGAHGSDEPHGLPHLNLAFEAGALNVHGPSRARFTARLRGRAWVRSASASTGWSLAERVAQEQVVKWAEVARELGYHDQGHLIQDFKRQIGFTPQAYARQCAERAE